MTGKAYPACRKPAVPRPELVCLPYEVLVRTSLGISAISSDAHSWKGEDVGPGAQVDLVMDRADGVVNLCETKRSPGEYPITKSHILALRNKLVAFVRKTHTRKAPRLTFVTPFDLRRNAYRDTVRSKVVGDGLFAWRSSGGLGSGGPWKGL